MYKIYGETSTVRQDKLLTLHLVTQNILIYLLKQVRYIFQFLASIFISDLTKEPYFLLHIIYSF